MGLRWHSLKAVTEGLKGHKQLRQRVLQKVLPKVARLALKELREGMPPSGAVSVFDGYASTGKLRLSFGTANPKVIGNKVSISIGQKRGTSKRLQMIARVHENGAVIRPKAADGWLVFRIEGRWVRVKRVKIRAKHYFRDGWKRVQTAYPKWVEQQVREELGT